EPLPFASQPGRASAFTLTGSCSSLSAALRGAGRMGAFDYLFSFYGLLLGIAVANVAIGFADMWRDCERIAVGTCPSLVASGVLLGGMNVWLQMWLTRPYVTVNGIQMLAAAAIALPYVFVSRAIFPGVEEDEERSLEA